MRLVGVGSPVPPLMMSSETGLVVEGVVEGNPITFPEELGTKVVPSRWELPVSPEPVESSLGSGPSQLGTTGVRITLHWGPVLLKGIRCLCQWIRSPTEEAAQLVG